MTSKSRNPLLLALTVTLCLAGAERSMAAALTWDGGDNIWEDTVENGWNGTGTWSNANLDTATFDGVGGTVTVQSAITTGAAALAFNAGNYTLQSNDSTERVLTLGSNDITLGNGVTTTIGSNVTLSRAAALIVNGDTPTTSTLNIDSGGKLVNSTNQLVTIREATVNLNTGGTIETGRFSVVVGDTADGATLNVAGALKIGTGTNNQATNLVLGNGSTITSTVNLKVSTGGTIDFTTSNTALKTIRVGSTTTTGTLGVTTGIIDLEGGTATVDQIWEGRAGHNSTVNLHGGILKARGDQANFLAVDNVWVKSGGAKFDSNGKAVTVTKDLLTDTVSTGGGLILDDTAVTKGTLTLTGANTYTGDTTVTAGTLAVTGSLGATAVTVSSQATLGGNGNIGGSVSIDSGATHALAVAATPGAQVTRAITGTLTLTPGNLLDLTAVATPAAGEYVLATADTISGTTAEVDIDYNGIPGTVTVDTASNPDRLLLTVTSSGFSAWITGTFAGGATVPLDKRGPNDDPDNDGISNLVEYAIAGQDPTVPNASVGSFNGTLLSFSKRLDASGLAYAIQESTDLGGGDDWTEVTGGTYVNNAGTISYTFTPGTPAKNFLRLQVTQLNP